MTTGFLDSFEARVLATVTNLGVANGNPYLIVRDENTKKYGLAQQIGDLTQMCSAWIDPQSAVDVATRVIGGDNRAVTHPTVLQALAVCLVGMVAEGQLERQASKLPEEPPK
jgi:hypothetical protein